MSVVDTIGVNTIGWIQLGEYSADGAKYNDDQSHRSAFYGKQRIQCELSILGVSDVAVIGFRWWTLDSKVGSSYFVVHALNR